MSFTLPLNTYTHLRVKLTSHEKTCINVKGWKSEQRGNNHWWYELHTPASPCHMNSCVRHIYFFIYLYSSMKFTPTSAKCLFSALNQINLAQKARKFVFGQLFCCYKQVSWQQILFRWKVCLFPLLIGATFVREMHRWNEQQSWVELWVELKKTCRMLAGGCHEEDSPRLLWLCMVHPHVTEAPVRSMKKTLDWSNVLCFLQTLIIPSNNQHQTRVNGRINCWALAENVWQVFQGAQTTYSTLLLIPQMHFLYKYGTI